MRVQGAGIRVSGLGFGLRPHYVLKDSRFAALRGLGPSGAWGLKGARLLEIGAFQLA